MQKGTSMWFYTWQDCDMIYASRNPDTYCSRPGISCDAYPQDLHTRLNDMATKYKEFRANNKAWQTEYARGHCKLNHLAARYSIITNGGVRC
jgi:hypothetical protein